MATVDYGSFQPTKPHCLFSNCLSYLKHAQRSGLFCPPLPSLPPASNRRCQEVMCRDQTRTKRVGRSPFTAAAAARAPRGLRSHARQGTRVTCEDGGLSWVGEGDRPQKKKAKVWCGPVVRWGPEERARRHAKKQRESERAREGRKEGCLSFLFLLLLK